MKKRNLAVVLLSFGVLISLLLISNYVFAAQQTILSNATTGQAGVFQVYNISVQNIDPKLNLTQVNMTLTASSFSITSFNTSTNATVIPSATVLQFVNNSISLIKNGTTGYFWFNAMTTQIGVFNITVMTLDNNSVMNSTNISVTISDTIPPTISFVNQTPSNGATGLTSIPVNVSASDSGSGLNNVTIYLSNASGLVGGSPITNTSPIVGSFYYNFTSLGVGTYYLWAITFDNANNSASTSNLTLTTTNSTPICNPSWSCVAWGTCANSSQICTTMNDSNSCGVSYIGTTLNQTCTVAQTCVTNWKSTEWTPAGCGEY